MNIIHFEFILNINHLYLHVVHCIEIFYFRYELEWTIYVWILLSQMYYVLDLYLKNPWISKKKLFSLLYQVQDNKVWLYLRCNNHSVLSIQPVVDCSILPRGQRSTDCSLTWRTQHCSRTKQVNSWFNSDTSRHLTLYK